MAAKEQYHSGHDIKSLLLNLAMSILLALPYLAYMYPEYIKEEIGVTIGGFVIAFLAPPYGVLRPHPFSDSAYNTPYLMKGAKAKEGTTNNKKE